MHDNARRSPTPQEVSSDIKELADLYEELGGDHKLRDQLSRQFWLLEGNTGTVEESRCFLFFLLGQLYERKRSRR
jgi:hypothetical protein